MRGITMPQSMNPHLFIYLGLAHSISKYLWIIEKRGRSNVCGKYGDFISLEKVVAIKSS
jgi:hypothetical protein